MSIITGGLGGTHIITQGYGYSGKWRKAHHKHIIELCPACHIELKNNMYYTRNAFSTEKIYRCSNCYVQLEFENGVWRCVERRWEDDF